MIHAYLTAYSWYDNTPPGSGAISNPVLHDTAGGAGTWADPLTIAVGHSITSGVDTLDWPAGTRFYVPNLRKYFIVEDTCGDGGHPQEGPCHAGYPSGASTWLDMWAGRASEACLEAVTDVHAVIVDPAPGYPVVAGDIGTADGCAQQYGDDIPAVA